MANRGVIVPASERSSLRYVAVNQQPEEGGTEPDARVRGHLSSQWRGESSRSEDQNRTTLTQWNIGRFFHRSSVQTRRDQRSHRRIRVGRVSLVVVATGSLAAVLLALGNGADEPAQGVAPTLPTTERTTTTNATTAQTNATTAASAGEMAYSPGTYQIRATGLDDDDACLHALSTEPSTQATTELCDAVTGWEIVGQQIRGPDGSCLTVVGDPRRGDVPVKLLPCGAEHQSWRVIPETGEIQNLDGGCLDANWTPDGRRGVGSLVEVWVCNDSREQNWLIS
jgi:hypothetical protein